MSTFTELHFGEVPITEEGVERIRFSDSMDSHFVQLAECEDINCSVGRIYSEMKVPFSWFQIRNANYIIGVIEYNNPPGSLLKMYGWIDSIDPISDSEDAPVARVKWHFDYFEMYKNNLILGYGHIRRRPAWSGDTYPANIPVQNFPFRFKKAASKQEILKPTVDSQNAGALPVWWVIFTFNENTYPDPNNDQYVLTTIHYACFPVLQRNLSQRVRWNPDPVNPWVGIEFLNMKDVIEGNISEEFGLDPKDISGVWLSPVPPNASASFTHLVESGGYRFMIGYLDSNWTLDQNSIDHADPNDPAVGYFVRSYPYNSESTYAITEFTPDEFNDWMVQSFGGEHLLTIPYGMTISKVQVRTVITATECSLSIRFLPKGQNVADPMHSRSMGLECTIPLIPLPLNENAWDSYRYSGQREHDIETRIVQSNTNAWRTAAGGGGSGAMMGAFGPAGLAAGVIGGVSGGLIGYGVEMLYTNDEMKKFDDRLAANQPAGILLSGDGEDILFNCQMPALVKMTMDDYSVAVNNDNIVNYGYSVDEIKSSVDALRLQTGFWQVSNLILSGNAPKEAKDYIKKKFESGVKLI